MTLHDTDTLDARVAVLIPCLNEENTVEAVVRAFRKELSGATVYVYDNNSTDRTAERAAAAGAVVRREPRQGKGNVLRSMFRDIDADAFVLVDGDDTYPADSAPEMVRLILEDGADMVVGDRLSSTYAMENKRRFHNIGNNLVRRLVNRLFHGSVMDIMTGYRAFSPLFVKSFPILSKGFEIETEMTIHALDKNFVVRNIPVKYRDRPIGSESKLNTFSDGIKVLRTIFRMLRDYRPRLFFGALAASAWIVAAAMFTPVFIDYCRTGLVPKFPTLIVSGVAATFGLLFLVCGLILDTVAQKHRILFELHLNLLHLQMGKATR